MTSKSGICGHSGGLAFTPMAIIREALFNTPDFMQIVEGYIGRMRMGKDADEPVPVGHLDYYERRGASPLKALVIPVAAALQLVKGGLLPEHTPPLFLSPLSVCQRTREAFQASALEGQPPQPGGFLVDTMQQPSNPSTPYWHDVANNTFWHLVQPSKGKQIENHQTH